MSRMETPSLTSRRRARGGHRLRQRRDAVSSDYTPRFEFSGGRIIRVVYDVADDVYLDAERQMAAALARD